MKTRKTASPANGKPDIAKSSGTIKGYKWDFKPRFRHAAFGWRSETAISRIKEAVKEIKKVARQDPLLGAEGAVIFFERLSPAIENVDSSSGAIGNCVYSAICDLVPLIADAPADLKTRENWLERLWEAHDKDQVPYIERITELWGDLCVDKGLASKWADRLIDGVRHSWRPSRQRGEFFNGIDGCFSSLYKAERYEDILDLLKLEPFVWADFRHWGGRAYCKLGRLQDGIKYLEESRNRTNGTSLIDKVCEELLLSAGETEAAYSSYAMAANQCSTHLATYRVIQKKYSHKSKEEIIFDLIEASPGAQGKWFATAKEAGLFDVAIKLAQSSPCDPKTLARAMRDFSDSNPTFALACGLAALHWLTQGYGYEITGNDVISIYKKTIKIADALGRGAEANESVRQTIANVDAQNFVRKLLINYTDLSAENLSSR